MTANQDRLREAAESLSRMMIIGFENEAQGNIPWSGHIHKCQSCYEKAKELRDALAAVPEVAGGAALECRITENHLERARIILGRTDNPVFLAQLLANFDGGIALLEDLQKELIRSVTVLCETRGHTGRRPCQFCSDMHLWRLRGAAQRADAPVPASVTDARNETAEGLCRDKPPELVASIPETGVPDAPVQVGTQKFILICPICKHQAEEGEWISIVGCSRCNPSKLIQCAGPAASDGAGLREAKREAWTIVHNWVNEHHLSGRVTRTDRAALITAISDAIGRQVADCVTAFQDEYSKHDSPLVGVVRGIRAMQALAARAALPSPPADIDDTLRDDNWFASQALDVIRLARTNEPHDDWFDWQSAIVNGLLRAFNRGRAALPSGEGKK
jgi:hypothetical protein